MAISIALPLHLLALSSLLCPSSPSSLHVGEKWLQAPTDSNSPNLTSLEETIFFQLQQKSLICGPLRLVEWVTLVSKAWVICSSSIIPTQTTWVGYPSKEGFCNQKRQGHCIGENQGKCTSSVLRTMLILILFKIFFSTYALIIGKTPLLLADFFSFHFHWYANVLIFTKWIQEGTIYLNRCVPVLLWKMFPGVLLPTQACLEYC